MSPPDRRRRRVRPAIVVGAVLAALVVAILVGALTRVGSATDPYWGRVDRSYAAQGRVLVDRSNHSGAQLRQLLATWARSSRQLLEVKLDLLARTTARTAAAAAALAPPEPWGGLGEQFSSAMADRARAVGDLRAAVDGLLGMSPLPPVTAGGTTPATALVATTAGATTATGADHGPTLSASQATSDVAGAGALLERADGAYAAVRRSFARAPGSADLPGSRWVLDRASWSQGPVETLVSQLAGTPTLAATHEVVLVPSAIAINPAPLPSTGKVTKAGASRLPPTHALEVTAVVADYGNVPEHDLVVTASVQPADGSGTAVQHRSAPVALAPGGSTAVQLASLPVHPGRTYRLTVSVTPPPGEASGLSTSQTFTVAVTPAASPPPATTTTTTPSHAKAHAKPHGSSGSKG